MHRHHVSWGYYVDPRHRAGLPPRRRAGAASGSRSGRSPPGSGTRCRTSSPSSTTTSSATSRRPAASCAGPHRAPAGRQLGGAVRPGQRAPAGPGQQRPVLRHPPGELGDARQGLELDRVFLAWDDWGGFYDHVRPPYVDANGYGFRVPGHRDQPLRPARVRRPPVAVVRRLREVHRGRLPARRRGSTRAPTAAPTRGRTCARTTRGWATWSGTSTSPSDRGRRGCSPSTRTPR